MSEEIRVAVINIKTGLVENIAVMKEGDGSAAPDGFVLFASDDAAIGDSFDGNAIVKAPAPIQDIPVDAERPSGVVAEPATLDGAPTMQQQIDALTARLVVLEKKAGITP